MLFAVLFVHATKAVITHKIYSRRWSQEVIFKESKGLLGLGKCQSANFAAQIASTSLVALQYNIFSAVRRFMDYETIGELFRQATLDSHELTISERIWQAILEFVAAITKEFSIDDEEVLDARLMNPMNLLISVNYINAKWRVRNSRNLNNISEWELFKRLCMKSLSPCYK